MKLYIDRIKKDLPCGSKYGRPWPYNEVPENASRKVYWSRPRVSGAVIKAPGFDLTIISLKSESI